MASKAPSDGRKRPYIPGNQINESRNIPNIDKFHELNSPGIKIGYKDGNLGTTFTRCWRPPHLVVVLARRKKNARGKPERDQERMVGRDWAHRIGRCLRYLLDPDRQGIRHPTGNNLPTLLAYLSPAIPARSITA